MEAEVDQQLDAWKISLSNMIKSLNREIRRWTSVVGIFPDKAFYVRLIITYMMEYAEDWSVFRVCSIRNLLRQLHKWQLNSILQEAFLRAFLGTIYQKVGIG